jgi:hypothetical protein
MWKDARIKIWHVIEIRALVIRKALLNIPFLVVACLSFSSTHKREAIHVPIHSWTWSRITLRYTTEDSTVHILRLYRKRICCNVWNHWRTLITSGRQMKCFRVEHAISSMKAVPCSVGLWEAYGPFNAPKIMSTVHRTYHHASGK